MNTANKITMIRVVLVPIFMVLFMIDNVMCHYAALGVFVLASITDAIDGHVARKYNQTIVLVTHDPELAQYADRIVTLVDGRIVSDTKGENNEQENK